MSPAVGAVLQVVAATVATAAVYGLLPSPTSATPSAVAGQLVRASGFTALGWAYLGLLLGLGAGTRVGRWPARLPRAGALSLHRQLNLTALALTVLHLAAFVVAPGGSLLVALVPQTAQVGALGYTLGVLSFYLALLLGPTWYVRDRLGRWAWLVLHQFAALSYATALWHTLALGGDLRMEGALRTLLWVAQVPLLTLLVLRLTHPRRPADHLNAPRRHRRFAGARLETFRVAVHTGVVLTALVVLFVALIALREGQHATG